MKERPIPFRPGMVKAILENRKTMTRRPIKPQPEFISLERRDDYYFWNVQWKDHAHFGGGGVNGITKFLKCPYGIPGDRLWVRESFWCVDLPDMCDTPCLLYEDEFERYQQNTNGFEIRPCSFKFGHHPSIHMPRWVSRITLEITNVRVERLQDIMEEDAGREGVDWYAIENKLCNVGRCRQAFQRLWDSAYSNFNLWSFNPWVWVIEFKR